MVEVTIRLNDRCQPEFRGALYEDPLQLILETDGRGCVQGGGTQMAPGGEVAFCEIELSLSSAEQENFDFVIDKLNELGAPKKSTLRFGSIKEIQLGVNEGMGIYLNGTDLPREVYEQGDVNFVIEELLRALDSLGRFHGYWGGPRETALYFYGPSFAQMREHASPILASYPLCRKARVDQIA